VNPVAGSEAAASGVPGVVERERAAEKPARQLRMIGSCDTAPRDAAPFARRSDGVRAAARSRSRSSMRE
jgi:hypothetical protein